MNNAFTQFPWVISQPNGKSGGWRVGPAWLGYAESETNNDRHLISAAPDLLEALEAVFNMLEQVIPGSPGSPLEKARAAISKAKGQS